MDIGSVKLEIVEVQPAVVGAPSPNFESPPWVGLDPSGVVGKLGPPLGSGSLFVEASTSEALDSERQGLAVYRAKAISLVSIAASVVVGFVGIFIGLEGGALAVIGLAGETLLDAVSSVMVIWRFKKGKSRDCQDKGEATRMMQARDAERERRFTLIIGVSFIVFSAFLLLLSLVHLTHQWADEAEEVASASRSWYVAWPAFVVFAVFSYFKFQLATELDSKTLRQDAICSVFGSVLALITGLASSLENIMVQGGSDVTAFAILDPLASIVISLLIMIEGFRTFYHNTLLFQTHRQFV